MAALSAARHHKTLRPFYEKLIAKGKKKLVAVMRKLLIICNAMLRPARPKPELRFAKGRGTVENAVLASLGDDAKGEMPPLGQKSKGDIFSADPAQSELMTGWQFQSPRTCARSGQRGPPMTDFWPMSQDYRISHKVGP
jgi:hypothetical protein